MSEDTTKNVAEETAPAVREGHRKVRIGTVVSAKQDKTIVVAVARNSVHPLYKKVMKSTTKCYAHDEKNEAHEGDVVEIMETRPLSKMKRWRLVAIQKHAAQD